MHEGHFTEKIVEAVVRELDKSGGRKVKSVTVKVGEVYHLMPESVLMHYDLAVSGTRLEGVKLNLLEEAMEVVCQDCGKRGPVEDHHLLMCTYCHSRQVKAVAGDQVTIEHVEFEA